MIDPNYNSGNTEKIINSDESELDSESSETSEEKQQKLKLHIKIKSHQMTLKTTNLRQRRLK